MFICYKCFIYVHNYSHVSRRNNPLIIQRVAKSTVIKESRKYAPEFTLAHKKWVDFLYGHIIHYLTHHFALWCLFKRTWGCELHSRKKIKIPVSGDNKFTVAVLTVWFLWILTHGPHQLSFIPVLTPAVAQWCKGGGLHLPQWGSGPHTTRSTSDYYKRAGYLYTKVFWLFLPLEIPLFENRGCVQGPGCWSGYEEIREPAYRPFCSLVAQYLHTG